MRGSIHLYTRSTSTLAITMHSAENSTVPMIIGRSMFCTACHASVPMPGQPNTYSMISAPPSSTPRSSAVMVTRGRRAFLKACLNITRLAETPLARAVRM